MTFNLFKVRSGLRIDGWLLWETNKYTELIYFRLFLVPDLVLASPPGDGHFGKQKAESLLMLVSLAPFLCPVSPSWSIITHGKSVKWLWWNVPLVMSKICQIKGLFSLPKMCISFFLDWLVNRLIGWVEWMLYCLKREVIPYSLFRSGNWCGGLNHEWHSIPLNELWAS